MSTKHISQWCFLTTLSLTPRTNFGWWERERMRREECKVKTANSPRLYLSTAAEQSPQTPGRPAATTKSWNKDAIQSATCSKRHRTHRHNVYTMVTYITVAHNVSGNILIVLLFATNHLCTYFDNKWGRHHFHVIVIHVNFHFKTW